MITYSEKTTAELIQLLLQEEDRVTLEHIQELATRPDSIEPLREKLQDDFYWLGDEGVEWWLPYHALTIFSATKNPELLPDMVAGLLKAYEVEFDWIYEISPAMLSHFGEPAVEFFINFISQHRDSHHDNYDFTYARSQAFVALARTGLNFPALRAKIAEFGCSLLTDPNESDSEFLGFILFDVLTLDREKGAAAAKIGFERNAIATSISGDYERSLELFDSRAGELGSEYTRDLFEFYLPQEISKRQERWQEEKDEEALEETRRTVQRQLAQFSRQSDSRIEPKSFDSSLYSRAPEGNLIRAEKIGRNDPCPCGSGKKYKKCHGK
ncbi:MAG: SEC-C metal-binding domain-containing protein [Blastocatellia bacterium]